MPIAMSCIVAKQAAPAGLPLAAKRNRPSAGSTRDEKKPAVRYVKDIY
jgi:hypothetical protein